MTALLAPSQSLWGTFFLVFLSFFKIIFNVYFRERERERERQSMSRAEAERDGVPESEAGSKLQAVSPKPDTGLEHRNVEIMT